MSGKINHINPEGLMKSPAFSQAIITEGNGKTIYIGGQNAVDQKGQLVGKGDLKLQTEQVMQNIITALEACNATFENVIKFSVYIVQGQNIRDAFESAQKYMSSNSKPPVVTGMFVAGLNNPDYLIEVEAIAFVAE